MPFEFRPTSNDAIRGAGSVAAPLAAAHLAAAAVVLSLASGPLRAEEPKGCDAFKWPLKHEADLLLAPGNPVVASGAASQVDGKAYQVKLVAYDDAHLPQPPERKPKYSPSTAALLRYAAPKSAGTVQITLSQAAWVDVVQDGRVVKPSAFSGAHDCPGVRKSIRVTLAPSPFIVQISGTNESTLGLVAAMQP